MFDQVKELIVLPVLVSEPFVSSFGLNVSRHRLANGTLGKALPKIEMLLPQLALGFDHLFRLHGHLDQQLAEGLPHIQRIPKVLLNALHDLRAIHILTGNVLRELRRLEQVFGEIIEVFCGVLSVWLVAGRGRLLGVRSRFLSCFRLGCAIRLGCFGCGLPFSFGFFLRVFAFGLAEVLVSISTGLSLIVSTAVLG